jgi:hypothetical protein
LRAYWVTFLSMHRNQVTCEDIDAIIGSNIPVFGDLSILPPLPAARPDAATYLAEKSAVIGHVRAYHELLVLCMCLYTT